MYKSNVKNSNGEGGIKSQIARMLKLINIVENRKIFLYHEGNTRNMANTCLC